MPDFQSVQAAFAGHLRDPSQPPPPDIEDRRMAIYRRLFFNNIEAFLSNAFPVLRRIYADSDWRALVRSFYARHRCRRPQFYQVAEEFLEYLAEEHESTSADPPFLLELAHYEWVELILAIDPTPLDAGGVDPEGDLLDARPVLTPWLENLVYRYPVHCIGPDHQPQQPPEQPTCLLVFRKPDERIGFLEINPMTARLVDLLRSESGLVGRQALQRLARESGMAEANLLEFGAGLLQQLRELGVILGARQEQ